MRTLMLETKLTALAGLLVPPALGTLVIWRYSPPGDLSQVKQYLPYTIIPILFVVGSWAWHIAWRNVDAQERQRIFRRFAVMLLLVSLLFNYALSIGWVTYKPVTSDDFAYVGDGVITRGTDGMPVGTVYLGGIHIKKMIRQPWSPELQMYFDTSPAATVPCWQNMQKAWTCRVPESSRRKWRGPIA
jgi:hypothetical protein